MTRGRAFAVGVAVLASVSAVSCAASPSSVPPTDGGSVVVVARSTSSSAPQACDPAGETGAGGDRSCAAVTTYRLAVEDPSGAMFSLRVDAAVYQSCGVGDHFPACAQEAAG